MNSGLADRISTRSSSAMSPVNLLKFVGVLALPLLSVPLGLLLRSFSRKRILAALPSDLRGGLAGGLSFESPNVVIKWSDTAELIREKLHLNKCQLPTGVRLLGLEVTGAIEFCREIEGACFSDQIISTLEVWGPVNWNPTALLSEYESTATRLIELLGAPSTEVAHTHVFCPDHKERIWDFGWLSVTHRLQHFKSEAVCQNLLFDRREAKPARQQNLGVDGGSG